MIIVVDASVAAMWFLPEAHSEKAATLIESDHQLIAPDLLRLEAGSVLLRATRRGWVDRADATAALDRLTPPAMRFEPADAYADAAWKIAARHGGSIYDAAYVAVARALDAAVVTNDGDLAEKARAPGLVTWLLADPPPRGMIA